MRIWTPSYCGAACSACVGYGQGYASELTPFCKDIAFDQDHSISLYSASILWSLILPLKDEELG
jgi:hypothetical protein